MSFKLIGNHLSPSDGEVVVRTYHCTYLSPIFALIGLKTDGYLTVTNKRVVYFAEGESGFGVAGSSKLYTEVSIADVSNLSLGKGTRFSLLRLLCGLIFGPIFAGAVASLLSGIMILLKVAAGGGNPYLLRFCVFLQLATAVLLVFRSAAISRENIFRVMLAASGLSLVLSLPALGFGYGGAWQSTPPIYLAGTVLLSIPLAGYWLWCLYWFVRREYLTMAIASKSGLVTPIKIAGVSWWGRINVAADLASGMAPAVDAEMMFKELGAVVTDIQTLGDHGVEKWVQSKPEWPDVNLKRSERPYLRHAMIAILAIGAIVGGESLRYLIVEKMAEKSRAEAAMKADALRVEAEKTARISSLRTELADVRKAAEDDWSIREWVPKMWASAEQKASACETTFSSNQYEEVALHLREAIDGYANLRDAATAMKNASKVQSKYGALMAGMYVEESASERLKEGSLMSDFAVLMNQHPSSNDNWKAVLLGVDKAKLNAEQEKWGPAKTAWEYAGARLPAAIQLMRADLLVDIAEQAIKDGDAQSAFEYAENAMKESPSHLDAAQRKKLAWTMMQYLKQFDDAIVARTVNAMNMTEFTTQLDLLGGADWAAIKEIVENARASAGRNDWEACASEWETVVGRLPPVIQALQKKKAESDLAAQMENIESAARHGNWAKVSSLAGIVLEAYPNHPRAIELKDKADTIEGANASERAYRRALEGALLREKNSEHIELGDMSDFAAHLERYNHEEWTKVLDAVDKAGRLSDEENGIGSSNEWSNACALLSSALQGMRAEVWVASAEQEAASNNWAKALICAEKALKEKPDHIRARELRDQADQIEEMRVRQNQYEQLLQKSADEMNALGGGAGDRSAWIETLGKHGGAAWRDVQDLANKAVEFNQRGLRPDSIAAWQAALNGLPLAIRQAHVGYWLDRAKNDAKDNLWGKVSIEAERVLAKDPDNESAKALKREAEKNSK